MRSCNHMYTDTTKHEPSVCHGGAFSVSAATAAFSRALFRQLRADFVSHVCAAAHAPPAGAAGDHSASPGFMAAVARGASLSFGGSEAREGSCGVRRG